MKNYSEIQSNNEIQKQMFKAVKGNFTGQDIINISATELFKDVVIAGLFNEVGDTLKKCSAFESQKRAEFQYPSAILFLNGEIIG